MKPIVLAGCDKRESETEKKNRALARRAAAEGFVLLKNEGALPLTGKRIALYGSGARMTVKGGTGSGAVRERYSVTIEQGLLSAGYEIATKDWLDRFDRYYADTYETYRKEQEKRVEGMREFYQILGAVQPFSHPTGIPVTAEDIRSSGTDTAIYVLARQGGEGNDRRDVPGDYRLDETEYANIKAVSEGYEKLIVVINVGGVIDVSFLDTMRVNALVYYVQGGEEGGNALADVLGGKVNFSGKLATSWAYEFSDIPSNTTYSYLGEDAHRQTYNEGIYVGYRYFDTFGVAPRFPFGYGLSYTTFAVWADDVKADAAHVTVRAWVKNEGGRAGKEVVQLYATVPFYREDTLCGAEQKRLIAFAKTKELAPGEETVVTFCVPTSDLASYDEGRSAYRMGEGDYILRLGTSSADTVPAAVLRLDADVVTEQCAPVCPRKREVAEIVPPERAKEDISGLPVIAFSAADFRTVTHVYGTEEQWRKEPYRKAALQERLWKLLEHLTTEELATLVCGGGTSGERLVTAMGASGTTTSRLYEMHGIPNVILSDGPAGLNLTGHIVELPDGSYRAARVEENLEAYKRYLFGFSKTALMSQMAAPEDGISHYQYCTAWPCSQLLAQTFDVELLEKIGDATGSEMEAYGVTVWLAPGMNIHRNPLCGRTFEYYSEDPLVSGKLAAALVRGVQRHPGKGVSVKHFAANNCELNRNESSSDMHERALREIYLRGFEIAVKEAAPMTVMASYNMINDVYATNNYDLLVKVLREEWGFTGLVMSDWDAMKASRDDCMEAATGDVLRAAVSQCDLIMPGRPDQVEAIVKGVESGAVLPADLKRSAARVLRLVAGNTAVPV